MEITKSQAERRAEFGPIADHIFEAKNILKQKKNVIDVGIAYKEKAGTKIEQMCFAVYVEEKQSTEQLSSGDMIPAEIFGIPTDVIKIRAVKEVSWTPGKNTEPELPLRGGTQLKSKIDSVGPGTLGCLATWNVDGSLVMLSNYHVMVGTGDGPDGLANRNDAVYHPLSNPVGNIVDFKRPGLGQTGDVDVAIARVIIPPGADNIIIANKIKGLGKCKKPGQLPSADINDDFTDSDEAIEGVALMKKVSDGHGNTIDFPIELGARVRKVGRTTGRTVGKIEGVGATMYVDHPSGDEKKRRYYSDQMQIVCYPADVNTEFVKGGDSGSVVVDDNNKIVGLVATSTEFIDSGAPGPKTPDSTHANNIHNALAAMNISIYVPPVARFNVVPPGKAPYTVNFDGNSATDAEGAIKKYLWDTGDRDVDGTFASGAGATFSFTYAYPGTYYATLTVVDEHGLTGRTTQTIVVNP